MGGGKKEKWFSSYIDKEIPQLSNKVCVITGTTSGTGYWATVTAIRKKCSVVYLLNRSSPRVEASLKALEQEKQASQSNTRLESLACDLSSFKSVKNCAEKVKEMASETGIDVLINNAGMEGMDDITEDGYLRTAQVNHLSHFLLSLILKPVLVKGTQLRGEARVVNHSSGTRYWNSYRGKDFAKVPKESKLRSKKGKLYGSTKISNCLFSLEWNKQFKDSGVKAVSAEPGVSSTPLAIRNISGLILTVFGQCPADGAMPLVTAAFANGVKADDLYCPKGWFYIQGTPRKAVDAGKSTWRFYRESNILDKKAAADLWQRSKEAVNEYLNNAEALVTS